MAVIIGVVLFALAGIVGWYVVGRMRPMRPDDLPGDDAERVLPDGIPAQAIVRSLRQVGTSRGISVHRCELGLVMPTTGAGPLRAVTVLVDLPTDSLAWFVPGSVIDVLVDPAEPARVVPSIHATRLRRVGLDALPEVSCRGLPDHVFLKPPERLIEQPIPARAVIGCIDIGYSEYSIAFPVTYGLWVLPGDGAAPYATKISERLAFIAIIDLPLGANVPVDIDPADPKRVVVDLDNARRELVAATVPPEGSTATAAASLGHSGLGQVRLLQASKGQSGVRRACRVTSRRNGADADVVEDVMLPVPELFALVPGSPVVIGRSPEGEDAMDLDATAETRALAAVLANGWGDELPAARS